MLTSARDGGATASVLVSRIPEQYDRGEKLRQYQHIASLSHVVLVAHHEKRIDVWTRGGEGWSLASARSGERVELVQVGCAFEVDDVYRDPLNG